MKHLMQLCSSVVLATMIACGSNSAGESDAATNQGSDGATPADAGMFNLQLDWQPCSFYSYGTDTRAVCANVNVPVDWNDPRGDTISLFVKRLGDIDKPGQQLWFLMGGPGGASAGYEGLSEQLLGADDALDIYLLDHRGTGRSSRLGCSAQESESSENGYRITEDEWLPCRDAVVAEWGAGLAHFSTTNAANDLGHLIDATRAPGQRVHVNGGSYGTFWAQRYLQVFPTQPTSVSMVGVVSPDASFTTYNADYETLGQAYLDKCKADSFCVGKLGPDPETRMRAVMDDIGAACPQALAAGLNRVRLRQFFGANMLWGWDERLVALAITYRLERCSAADVTALQYFAANVSDPLDGLRDDRLFSAVTNMHVGMAELWEEPVPTVAQEQALLDNALFAFGSTTRLKIGPQWPAYPEDQYADVFATTAVPILMINGELDPASTLERALTVGAHFNGPNQHFVELPGGSHTWASPTTEGYNCGINIFWNFLQEPTDDLLDCVGIIVPLDFRGNATLASSMFGTSDLWENSSAAPAPPPDARIIRRMQQWVLDARGGDLSLRH